MSLPSVDDVICVGCVGHSDSPHRAGASWVRSLSLKLAVSLGALALAAGLGACSKESGSAGPAPAAEEKAAQPGGGGHAPAGVKPGSHEDWCAEHAVPESQCTRCNAELIPAFKATNDWCPEHGLPESQCEICNPEIEIKRPPKGA